MTIHMTWPDHLLSLDEWDALPEDSSRRIELAEGVIQVAARPISRHQKLMMRLGAQLDVAANGRFEVRPDFEVIIDGGAAATVRAPDLVLAAVDLADAAPRIHARDAAAVVEILSPGSRRLDRVLKLHEYAEAGVPVYLLAEPDPPVLLTEFGLVDGTYRLVAEHAGTAPLELGVTLDLEALDA